MKKFALFAFAALLLFSCTKEEELTPIPQQPAVPQIILDTDIASSTDDLFALQLHMSEDQLPSLPKGRCSPVSVIYKSHS